MMSLPFLKRRKLPRNQEPIADKMVGLSGDEQLEDQMIEELMQACADRDPKKLRSTLEALLMTSFEHEE